MARYNLNCENLGACEICANCIETQHPLYYCGYSNDHFGKIAMPDECEDFKILPNDD